MRDPDDGYGPVAVVGGLFLIVFMWFMFLLTQNGIL